MNQNDVLREKEPLASLLRALSVANETRPYKSVHERDMSCPYVPPRVKYYQSVFHLWLIQLLYSITLSRST